MTTRDRILDAAAAVLSERGLAATTTKEIARAAACSEALLYKYFSGKQEIFLAVLQERVPPIARPEELLGTATPAANLATLVAQLLRFYVRSFPMAASVFGDRALLGAWRDGLRSRGAGPRGVPRLIESYLRGEQDRGRVAGAAPVAEIATLVAGAALQQAFFAAFDGASDIPDADDLAATLVSAVAPALTP